MRRTSEYVALAAVDLHQTPLRRGFSFPESVMRYRKLDANGDYSFGNQQADFYINTPEAVAQAVKTRLALFTGEWFLDVTEGTPWRTEVLGKYTQAAYDIVLKERIVDTPGVQSLDAY